MQKLSNGWRNLRDCCEEEEEEEEEGLYLRLKKRKRVQTDKARRRGRRENQESSLPSTGRVQLVEWACTQTSRREIAHSMSNTL